MLFSNVALLAGAPLIDTEVDRHADFQHERIEFRLVDGPAIHRAGVAHRAAMEDDELAALGVVVRERRAVVPSLVVGSETASSQVAGFPPVMQATIGLSVPLPSPKERGAVRRARQRALTLLLDRR